MKQPSSVQVKYGASTITIDVSNAKSVEYLQGKELPPIEDLKTAFHHAVTSGAVGSKPLDELLTKEDQVTIVISDITRYWDASGFNMPGTGGVSSYAKQDPV